MSVREMELEDCIHRNTALRPHITAIILRHAQIRWSNWLAAQWGKSSKVPFPDFAVLWTAMENQDPWEPTFPSGYTLSLEAAYGGGVSTRPTQGLAYLSRWTTLDTSTAPTSAAATATAAPTLKSELARRISWGSSRGIGGGGGSSGRSSGGVGGGGEGSEERLNAMAYNNAYVEGRWGLFLSRGIDAIHYPQGKPRWC